MGYWGLPEEGHRGEHFRSDMVHGRQYIVVFGNGGTSRENCFKAIKLFANPLAENGIILGGVVFSSGVDAQGDSRSING